MLLGGFTTFSAFSIETYRLFESGDIIKAMMNIMLSMAMSLIAVWLGIIIARYMQ